MGRRIQDIVCEAFSWPPVRTTCNPMVRMSAMHSSYDKTSESQHVPENQHGPGSQHATCQISQGLSQAQEPPNSGALSVAITLSCHRAAGNFEPPLMSSYIMTVVHGGCLHAPRWPPTRCAGFFSSVWSSTLLPPLAAWRKTGGCQTRAPVARWQSKWLGEGICLDLEQPLDPTHTAKSRRRGLLLHRLGSRDGGRHIARFRLSRQICVH